MCLDDVAQQHNEGFLAQRAPKGRGSGGSYNCKSLPLSPYIYIYIHAHTHIYTSLYKHIFNPHSRICLLILEIEEGRDRETSMREPST